MTQCPQCGRSSPQRRSYDQHKRFFGVVDAAFHQWPEAHKFQPMNAEHLRAWLLCAAKHLDVMEIDEAITERGADVIQKTMQGLRKDYVFIRIGRSKFYVMGARSIAYDKLSHKDACRVFADVDEILCSILQIDSTDQLLREHARAA